MSDIIEQAMKVIALTEEMQITHIRSSLHGSGSSRCESCGEIIPADRRALLPSATTCVTCQEIKEFKARIVTGESS